MTSLSCFDEGVVSKASISFEELIRELEEYKGLDISIHFSEPIEDILMHGINVVNIDNQRFELSDDVLSFVVDSEAFVEAVSTKYADNSVLWNIRYDNGVMVSIAIL